ncbi:WH2 domain-containing protein [Grimontia hollisae]|uniref:WH2 domain-containing protein n=1 Tax=Grimontia hollisae TaxID=673 RepID=UPI00165DAFAC|nr:WH2 domain-containing protein [Grimontia hollisae]
MFKITPQTQMNVVASAVDSHTQRTMLKISIKSVKTTPLTQKLQNLAEKYRRFSDVAKEDASAKRRTSSSSATGAQHPGSSTNATQNTDSESRRSSISSKMSSRTSSRDDLSSLSGSESDSVFVDVEPISASATNTTVAIPPAPPLPASLSAVSQQPGDIPPAPPLPSAVIPAAPELPKQRVQVKMTVTTNTDDPRSKLMEQIRVGVMLRPASQILPAEKSPTDTHSQLMVELLSGGAKLKRTSSSDIPPPPPLPMANTEKSEGGRNALLSEISNFSKARLRKTGSTESINTKGIEQPTDKSMQNDDIATLLLTDDLLSKCARLSESDLDALSKAAAKYLVTAAGVDVKQAAIDATRKFTHADLLKAGLQYEPAYVGAFCQVILQYPDCYKEADISSPESPKGSKASVIETAIKRLEGGRSRLFSAENKNGTRELKKGEAILESAIKAARAAMTDEEKSALLANNIKSETFKILTEMPFMEGFSENNGKAAFGALRKDFFAAITSSGNAKEDIAKFMRNNFGNGFSSYTYAGLTARLAKLEAQLAKLVG